MKYALVDGIKTEAVKGVKGFCSSCGSELIAKCGEQKINHWAHKGNRNCDPWWEPETEWHRSWKKNYIIGCQEVVLTDEKTGEKHIADVRTEHGLVIEFQHSHIRSEERISRERYYKNMVWVVDGTRLKRDYPRFLKGREEFRSTEKKSIYRVDFPDEVFPKNWLKSYVPIIFDFKGLEMTNDDDIRNNLFCLLPVRKGEIMLVAEFSREAFIRTTTNGE
ncbi:MAG: competence protein CoiA family protein [Petrimonas sp.]|uniref:competence protein CoiA n=1 Tax=Petrimonas sp. TaxID=2023866 RepID=UPI002B3953D9|nr:competence protein CoiA family protein [Petrimonas sp.]MEA5045128.1 competence protein CoiA family protein [Petrimonas sp.]